MRSGGRVCCLGLMAAAAAVLATADQLWAGNAVYKAEEIETARTNVAQNDSARKIRDMVVTEADRWLAKSDNELSDLIRPLTPRGALTVCPVDGGRLDCKPDAPWVPVCATCGRTFPPDQFPDDGRGFRIGKRVYYFAGLCNRQHLGVLTGAAHDLALAYALTGKVEYADKATVILTRIGQVYPGFQRHDPDEGDSFYAGKFRANTLEESGWIKIIVAAYDLVRDARNPDGQRIVTDERRNVIENGILREAAAVLMRARYGIHNIQATQNAALAAIGVSLEDPDLVHYAVDGPYGFHKLLANGVLDDGFWFEGSCGYHLYTLSSLMQLAHYTRGYSDPAGMKWSPRERYENLQLEQDPTLARMVRAVNRAVLPDGFVPALNDGSPQRPIDGVRAVAAGYRLSDMWSGGVERTPLHRTMSSQEFVQLFRKDPDFPAIDSAPPVQAAYDLAGFGLAVIKSDLTPTANLVAADHSLQVSGHEHRDLLQILPMFAGRMVSHDYGYMGGWQGVDRHAWAQHTVAHNTVVVDRQDQSSQALGRLELLNAAGPVRLMHLSGKRVYPQCTAYDRAVLMMSDSSGRGSTDYVLDLFRVEGGARHEYCFHAFGELSVEGLSNLKALTGPVSTTAPGFSLLEGFQRGTTTGNFEATWRRAGETPDQTSGLRLIMLTDPGTTVRFGPGYGSAGPNNEPVQMIIPERIEWRTQFVTVMEPLTGTSKIRGVRRLRREWSEILGQPALVVEIEGSGWTDHVEFSPAQGSKPVRWSLGRTSQGHMTVLYSHNGARASNSGWTLAAAPKPTGTAGQFRQQKGGQQVLLNLPVLWGSAVGSRDIVVDQPNRRLSRYGLQELETIGNAAWATLATDHGLTLSVLRADKIIAPAKLFQSAVPMPRRVELIGKPIYRADGQYVGTIEEVAVLRPGWHPYEKDALHEDASPLLIRTDLKANLNDLKPGEMLTVRDIALHTPLAMESFALLEETGPDSYRLTAPFGASVTIPTPYKDTGVLCGTADGPQKPMEAKTRAVEKGYVLEAAFTAEMLSGGPVEFRLTTEQPGN